MAKESKYSQDSRLIFRETFNSYDDVVRNGGNIGSFTLSDGILSTFADTVSKLKYNFQKRKLLVSIRLKIKIKGGDVNPLIIDFRTASTSATYSYIRISSNLLLSSPASTYYIDGVLQSTTPLENNKWYDIVFSGLLLNASEMTIGGAYTGNTFDLVSDIELVEIYKGTLTATEVQCLYNGTLYTEPDLDYIVRIKNVNGQTKSLGKLPMLINGSLSKKTGNTYMQHIPTIANVIKVAKTADITYDDSSVFSGGCWVKTNVLDISTSYYGLLTTRTSTTVNGFLLSIRGNVNNNLYRIYFNGLNVYAAKSNLFQHIVFTRNGTATKVYLNGVLIINSSTTVYTTTDGTYLEIGNLYSGYISSDGLCLRGYTDDSFIVNKELTQEEITRLYNSQKHLYR